MAEQLPPHHQEALLLLGGVHTSFIPQHYRVGLAMTDQPGGPPFSEEAKERIQALERLRESVKRVRDELNRNMPIQTLAVLLEIAYRPGSTPTEIAQRLGMSVSAAARNVSLLEKTARWTRQDGPERKGFDLIRTETDPSDWKRKLCYLNEKGLSLVQKLLEVK